jgi:pimeloyl-ACP methyl ester carboxylesterase
VSTVDVVLIPGLWLDASVWADVGRELDELGHRPHPLTLPGQGDGSTTATLDDQVAAVVAAVDALSGPVLVVGHSAASALAWVAADARPDKVAAVALVGGTPVADGGTYADFFPAVDGLVHFPGWEPFEGPDAADLDEDTRRRFEARACPVPEAVTKGVLRLTDERRYDVPVVMVCPEYSPEDARNWVESGDVPELPRAREVSYVDIDSGHWPMLTRPTELARLLGEAATR